MKQYKKFFKENKDIVYLDKNQIRKAWSKMGVYTSSSDRLRRPKFADIDNKVEYNRKENTYTVFIGGEEVWFELEILDDDYYMERYEKFFEGRRFPSINTLTKLIRKLYNEYFDNTGFLYVPIYKINVVGSYGTERFIQDESDIDFQIDVLKKVTNNEVMPIIDYINSILIDKYGEMSRGGGKVEVVAINDEMVGGKFNPSYRKVR